jgi:hypothetical protein
MPFLMTYSNTLPTRLELYQNPLSSSANPVIIHPRNVLKIDRLMSGQPSGKIICADLQQFQRVGPQPLAKIDMILFLTKTERDS